MVSAIDLFVATNGKTKDKWKRSMKFILIFGHEYFT